MNKYDPRLYLSRDKVPIMSNEDIERHAMIFANDYDPDILNDPHEFDISGFASEYLNVYMEKYCLSNNNSILGETIFFNMKNHPIYDPITRKIEMIDVNRRTILIDRSLTNPLMETLKRTTIAHECGHWIFHQDYFLSLYERLCEKLIACRKNDIELNNNRFFNTPIEWMEHHANYFSGCLLMPRKACFKVVCDNKLRDLAWEYAANLCGIDQGNQCLAQNISKTFNVSIRAAELRLKQLKCDLRSEAISKKESSPALLQKLTEIENDAIDRWGKSIDFELDRTT